MSIGARIKRAIGPGAGVGLKMGLIFGYLCIIGGMVVVGCLDSANSARDQSIGSIIAGSLFAAVIYGSIYFAIHVPTFAIGGVSVGIAAALVACVMERPQVAPAVGLVVGATSFFGGAGFPFGEMPFGHFYAGGFGACSGCIIGILVKRRLNCDGLAAVKDVPSILDA